MENQPNGVYDQDSENPITRPDLKSMEEGGGASQAPSAPGKVSGEGKTPEAPATATEAGASSSTGLSKGSVAGGFASGIKGAFQKNKNKGLIGGGAAGAALGIMIFAITFFVPMIVQHIANVILAEESKLTHQLENDVSKDITKELQKHSPPKVPSPSASGDPSTPEGDLKPDGTTKGSLAEETSKFNWEDPSIKNGLSDAGLDTFTKSDGSIGIKSIGDESTSPTDLSEKFANNEGGAWDKFSKAVPEWDVGQLTTFNNVLVGEANAPVSGLKDDPTKTAAQTEESAIVDGESKSSSSLASEAVKSTQSPDTNGDIGQAIQAAEEASNSGLSISDAVKAAQDKLPSAIGTSLNIEKYLADYCEVSLITNKLSKDRIPAIVTLMIRHSTLLFAVVAQMKSHKLSGQDLNHFMNTLQGSPAKVSENADGTPILDKTGEPIYTPSSNFSNSEAWQSAIGNNNGVNTDVGSNSFDPNKIQGLLPDSGTLPTSTGAQRLIDEVTSTGLTNIPGVKSICDALNNRVVGHITTAVGYVATLAADIGSLGAADVAQVAAAGAETVFVQYKLIPYIVTNLTVAGFNGLEGGASWMNNADSGANLSYNTYSRASGSVPMSKKTVGKLVSIANMNEIKSNSNRSIYDQIFALNNNNSLTSRLMNDIPMGKSAVFDSMINYFTKFPSVVTHSLSIVLSPRIFADTASPLPGDQYGLSQYNFNPGESTKYNIYSNEYYLNKEVSLNGNHKSRLSMLGDPSNLTQKNPLDNNSDNLLHCFAGNYTDIIQNKDNLRLNCVVSLSNNGGPNGSGCYVIGSTDYYDSMSVFAGADNTGQDLCGNRNSTILQDDQNLDKDMDQGLNSNICNIYTKALGGSGCDSGILKQINKNDDSARFRQYIADTNVMRNYISLVGNQ